MSTTINFKKWLFFNVVKIQRNLFLYRAVENEESEAHWSVTHNGDKLIIEGITDECLLIASQDAKQTFLEIMEETYCDNGEMDMESWCACHEAIDNDNSQQILKESLKHQNREQL